MIPSKRISRPSISAEEFYEWIQKESEEISDENTLPLIFIEKHKDFYEKAKQAEIPQEEKDYYKRKYVDELLKNGFRIKGSWDENGQAAKKIFESALEIVNIIPLAHYRLGHIAYKQDKTGEAINHFYNSLQQNEKKQNSKFCLDEIQMNKAKSILSLLCQQIITCLNNENDNLSSKQIPDFSNVYHNSNAVLALHLFQNHDVQLKEISYQDYIGYKSEIDSNSDSFYIDGYSHQICIGYQGRESQLSVGKYDDLFQILKGIEWESLCITRNTFNQRLRRLRIKLREINLNNEKFQIEYDQNGNPYVNSKLKIYFFKRIEE